MKTLKEIKLKEYEYSQLGDLNSKDIEKIEKINELYGSNIFDIGAKNRIKAKQFVGIIRINNKNIQILPKIFGKNQKILENLLYMLSYTKKLKIKESDIASLGEKKNIFEIYIYIFAKGLLKLLKKNLKKSYNLIEENSNFLKGKLLFSQNIKLNPFNKAKFFVSYDKFDENILLNIFLKSVISKIIRFTESTDNYKLLSKCKLILKDIDNYNFSNYKQLERINFNKQNKEYKYIFNLGKMLYFDNSPNLKSNSIDNFSILFDMNKLFEEFIYEIIKRNKGEFNIKTIYSEQPRKFIFSKPKLFQMKPDIYIEFKNGKKMIIDTKYKKLKNEYKYGIAQSDIYQMFAYSQYYETKYITLLYPKYNDIEDIIDCKSNKEFILQIKTINLNYTAKTLVKKCKNELKLWISQT